MDENTVDVNEKTQGQLRQLNMALLTIQGQMQAMVQGYVSALGLEGDWNLSGDMKKLIKVEDK
jgi:hypothetical protein